MNINTSFLLSFLLFIMIGISACSKKVPSYEELTDSKEGALVFVAKANTGIQYLTIFPYNEDERTFQFNAGLGALGLPSKAIAVSFIEDDHVFDSINAVRINDGLIPYEHFPKEAYDIDKLNLTIPKGGISSEFSTLIYRPKNFDNTKDHLLALTINDASGYGISSTAKTILLVANKVEERPANTSGWIAQASSEEPGQGTGLASAVLDGDLSTIWHSRYKPAPAEKYPHWISIDMTKEHYVTKVSIATRQNNLKGMTKFKLEGSRDGENWFALTEKLDFDPTNIGYQTYPIEPQYLNNIKITMLEGIQDPTFLSEFVVYSY